MRYSKPNGVFNLKSKALFKMKMNAFCCSVDQRGAQISSSLPLAFFGPLSGPDPV